MSDVSTQIDKLMQELEDLKSIGKTQRAAAVMGHAHVGQTIRGGVPVGISVPPPLTTEEKQELERLRADRKSQAKKAKLDEFKSFPAHVREAVITKIKVEAAFASLKRDHHAMPSHRERELEHKEQMSQPFGAGSVYVGSHGMAGLGSYVGSPVGFGYPGLLPQDVSMSDLEMAHAEACAEEMLKE